MPKRKRMSFTAHRKRVSVDAADSQAASSIDRDRSAPHKKPAQSDDEDEDDESSSSLDNASRATRQAQASEQGIQGPEEKEHESDDNGKDLFFDTDVPRMTAEKVYVRKDTISKKWEHLDYTSQRAVRQIFADVARPVIASQLGDKAGRDAEDSEGKSAEAQKAVENVVATLTQRLHRMPIPPKPSADAFNYEKLVRESAAAETQLYEQGVGIAALRARLKSSKDTQAKLDQEAVGFEEEVQKAETEMERRRQGKFAGLLCELKKEPEDSARRIRLVPRKNARSVLASDTDLGDEVKDLMMQLSQQVASIHTGRLQTSQKKLSSNAA